MRFTQPPFPELKHRLKGRVAFLGVGNRMRGDDAAGPRLIDLLKKKGLNKKFSPFLFEGGKSPENYLFPIIRINPDLVIIIDTVDFSERPGTIRIFRFEDIVRESFSTHRLSFRILGDYLKQQTKAEILIVGIQPRSVKLGEKMNQEVEKAIGELAEFLTMSLE